MNELEELKTYLDNRFKSLSPETKKQITGASFSVLRLQWEIEWWKNRYYKFLETHES